MKNGGRAGSRRSGMTLLEVLLAVMILGVCTAGLMQGLGSSAEVFRAAQFVRQAGNVLARGDAEHPATVNSDPVEDLEVPPDAELLDGWTYERVCEEDEDEDGIYVVRTRVTCGGGGPGNEIEFVSFVYCGDAPAGGR